MIKSGIFFSKDNKSTQEAPSVLPLAKLVYIVDFYFWRISKCIDLCLAIGDLAGNRTPHFSPPTFISLLYNTAVSRWPWHDASSEIWLSYLSLLYNNAVSRWPGMTHRLSIWREKPRVTQAVLSDKVAWFHIIVSVKWFPRRMVFI